MGWKFLSLVGFTVHLNFQKKHIKGQCILNLPFFWKENVGKKDHHASVDQEKKFNQISPRNSHKIRLTLGTCRNFCSSFSLGYLMLWPKTRPTNECSKKLSRILVQKHGPHSCKACHVVMGGRQSYRRKSKRFHEPELIPIPQNLFWTVWTSQAEPLIPKSFVKLTKDLLKLLLRVSQFSQEQNPESPF